MELTLSRKIGTVLVLLFGLLLFVSSKSFSIVDILGGALISVALATFITTPQFRSKILSGESLALLALGVLIILSYAFIPTDIPDYALLSIYTIGLYIAARFIAHLEFRDTFFSGYRLGASIASLLGIATVNFFSSTTLGAQLLQGHNLALLSESPLILGAFLIPAFIISLADFLKDEGNDTTNTIINSVTFIIILLALLYTGSLAVYGLTILATGTFLFHTRKFPFSTTQRIFSVLGTIAFIAILFFLFVSRQTFELDRISESFLVRTQNIARIAEQIPERDVRTLLIGSGNGSLETLVPTRTDTHSTYLRIFVENGLLGFTLLALFATLLISRVYGRENDTYRSVLIASCVMLFVLGCMTDIFHLRHAIVFLGLL